MQGERGKQDDREREREWRGVVRRGRKRRRGRGGRKRKRKIGEHREKENGWVKGTAAEGGREAVGGSGSLEIKVLFS